jgi:hypothetical protein
MSPVPNLAHLALLAAALLPAAPALARSIYNEKVEGFLKRQILETPTTTRLGTLTNTATATRPRESTSGLPTCLGAARLPSPFVGQAKEASREVRPYRALDPPRLLPLACFPVCCWTDLLLHIATSVQFPPARRSPSRRTPAVKSPASTVSSQPR